MSSGSGQGYSGQQPAWPRPQPAGGQPQAAQTGYPSNYGNSGWDAPGGYGGQAQPVGQYGYAPNPQAAAQQPQQHGGGYAPQAGSPTMAERPSAPGAGYQSSRPAFAVQPPAARPGYTADPYAPQFEPFNPAAAAAQAAAYRPTAPVMQPQAPHASNAPAWPSQPIQQPVSQPYAHPGYGAPQSDYAAPQQGFGAAPGNQATAWPSPQSAPHQDYYGAPGGYADQGDDLGFAQAAGGELDPNYESEEEYYEEEEPARSRRPMMVVMALVGAVMVGGGMAYSYKNFIAGGANGEPPTIKTAGEPSKVKPADAGGKQFAHSDSKIMGRLGEGSAASASATAAEADPSGTRKVSTLVVGRDGSIQAPAAAPVVKSESPVPGMTVVDALGSQVAEAQPEATAAPPAAELTAAPAAEQPAPIQVASVEPPPAPAAPPKVVSAPTPALKAPEPPQATGSLNPDAVPTKPAPKPAAKKVAALTPPVNDALPIAAAAAAPSGGNGYVAVLASVPRSTSSRMDALKRFADMQQKYSTTLNGKTPDVAEANLGAKGNYHRLVVGPPASREQASAVCAQLKSQGYADCWVTAY